MNEKLLSNNLILVEVAGRVRLNIPPIVEFFEVWRAEEDWCATNHETRIPPEIRLRTYPRVRTNFDLHLDKVKNFKLLVNETE